MCNWSYFPSATNVGQQHLLQKTLESFHSAILPGLLISMTHLADMNMLAWSFLPIVVVCISTCSCMHSRTSDEQSLWVTAIGWELLTFKVAPYTQTSISRPSSSTEQAVSILAQWSLDDDVQEWPTTQLHMRNSSYFSFDQLKALETVLSANCGSQSRCPLLHFQSVSARILNSRANWLIFLAICF